SLARPRASRTPPRARPHAHPVPVLHVPRPGSRPDQRSADQTPPVPARGDEPPRRRPPDPREDRARLAVPRPAPAPSRAPLVRPRGAEPVDVLAQPPPDQRSVLTPTDEPQVHEIREPLVLRVAQHRHRVAGLIDPLVPPHRSSPRESAEALSL